MRYFWQAVCFVLVLYIMLERQSCHPCRTRESFIYDTLPPDTFFKTVPVMRTEYKVLHSRDTVRVLKYIQQIDDRQKDSLLSELLGIKVYTRSFEDTLITAFMLDTVEAGQLRGKMQYRLNKPLVTILPEPKIRNKYFVGIGAVGNADGVFIFPELMLLTKKDNYLQVRYDPVNKGLGFSGGFKLGKPAR